MAPRKSFKRGDIISRSSTRRAKATAEAKKNAPVDVNAKIRKAADSFFGPNFSKNVKKGLDWRPTTKAQRAAAKKQAEAAARKTRASRKRSDIITRSTTRRKKK